MNGIQSYEQNMQSMQNAQGAGDATGKAINTRALNATAFNGVAAGSIVTGEVSAVHGKVVQIQLPNNQLVTARLEADIKVSVGQSMAFEVKSNSGSLVQLTPMFNSKAVNPAAIKALGQASILVNTESLKMATTMMEQGMSIDKNSLQTMMRMVSANPDADPASIVELTKQGLPIDIESIKQYESYKDNTHQLMNMATEVAEEISNVSDEISVPQRGELAQIFNGEASPEVAKEMKEGLAKIEAELSIIEPEEESVNPEKPMGILDIAQKMKNDSVSETGNSQAEEIVADEVLTNEGQEIIIKDDTALTRLLSQETREGLAESLSKLGMGEESARALISGDMEPQTALSYIQNAVNLVKNGSIDALNISDDEKNQMKSEILKLSRGDAFKSLLKESVIKSFSYEPGDELSKDKVTELYTKILKGAAEAQKLLEQIGKGDSGASKGLENIKQSVSFMNQLNENFTYMQLPLQLSGENAHADLYVYTNKKKLKEKDGDITALLHLEMDTLGNMDIHVTMKDTQHIKTHFVLEKEEMLDYIGENIHLLDERLEKRGYHMNSDVALKTKEEKADKNPAISAMLGQGAMGRARLLSKFSFDVKA